MLGRETYLPFIIFYVFLCDGILGQTRQAQYVPQVLVEALAPRGLRVSIPDREGIKLFSFHGRINSRIEEGEDGTFSKTVFHPENERWTYWDKSARIAVGDIIHYWTKIDLFDGRTQTVLIKDNQRFRVTELVSDTGGSTTKKTVEPTAEPTEESKNVEEVSSTTESSKCDPTPTLVNGKKSCKGKLVYEELFDQTWNERWKPEIKFADSPDYEFVIYQNDPENIFVASDMLHIKPTLVENRLGEGAVSRPEGFDLNESCTAPRNSTLCAQKPKAWVILPPVFSSQITTKEHFSFTYGVVEIRAKLPKGDWIYPELFLRSKNEEYGPDYDSGLIRIAFVPGNANMSKQLSGGGILGHSITARNFGLKTFKTTFREWNNEFHIFKLEWRSDRITLIVNNQEYGNIYPPPNGFASEQYQLGITTELADKWKKGTPMAPFDKEMYLVLGVGAGGFAFPDRSDGTKPWDNEDPKCQLHFYRAQAVWNKTWSEASEMVVDKIRVWAL